MPGASLRMRDADSFLLRFWLNYSASLGDDWSSTILCTARFIKLYSLARIGEESCRYRACEETVQASCHVLYSRGCCHMSSLLCQGGKQHQCHLGAMWFVQIIRDTIPEGRRHPQLQHDGVNVGGRAEYAWRHYRLTSTRQNLILAKYQKLQDKTVFQGYLEPVHIDWLQCHRNVLTYPFLDTFLKGGNSSACFWLPCPHVQGGSSRGGANFFLSAFQHSYQNRQTER